VAVKIVRQPNKIALLGAPTSAAAMSAGHEGAPSALRKAGLVERLTSIGYEVNDLGDDPLETYKPDEESPRARNISGVIHALEALKPRVEQAVKSAALPLILSGDCSVALATVAGARRYFRNVSLIYIDRDADLNTPATTPSGCVDGMVVSHLTGRGAAELVRFWGEPPLVREPDLALFGVDRLDPSEEEVLRRSPLRRYLADDVKRLGAAAAARAAIERVHGNGYEFILHFDVDVIADFQATNYPGSGGLTLEDVRAALEVFLEQKHLAAMEVAAYNPTKDSDGSAAKTIVDLLADVFEKRLESLKAPREAAVAATVEGSIQGAATQAVAGAPPEPPAKAEAETAIAASLPAVETGEAWSSDSPPEKPSTSTNEPAAIEESGEPAAAPAGAGEELPEPEDQARKTHGQPSADDRPDDESSEPSTESGEPSA
jgi:arginase